LSPHHVAPRPLPLAPLALALASLAVLGATATGCAEQASIGFNGPAVVALDLPVAQLDAVDVLFVIDNSLSMQDEQIELADGIEVRLFAPLLGSGLDLHIGVISTDVGTGDNMVGGCSNETNRNGDNGVLWQPEECTAADNNFLIDSPSTGDRNYEGDLGDAFACAGLIGTDGCGFEQPLESMRRALSDNPANAGFLRDDAALVVVIVTDEDDCSANPDLFANHDADVDSDLGPLDSFRCFEFGVTCADGPDDPRAPGRRQQCAPREDSLVRSVASYVDFLSDLKGGRPLVHVAVIAGPTDSIEVIENARRDNIPSLALSCGSESDESGFGASPAVRLEAFANSFGPRGSFESICGRFGSSREIEQLADRLRRETARCLSGDLADVDRAAGMQPVCRAYLRNPSAGSPNLDLARCGTDSGGTCYRLIREPACRTAHGLAVELGGSAPPPDANVVVECLANVP